MAIYNIGMFGSLIFHLIVQLFKDNEKRRVDSFLCFILFLFFLALATFRGDYVGTDLPVYLRRYYLIGTTNWDQIFSLRLRWGFETGFLLICKILYQINSNGRFFILITSLFTNISVYRAIKKYSKLQCLSYFFYSLFAYYATSFNLVRLFIALSICLWSIDSIIDRKPVRFALLMTLAVFIHTSAIIFVPLYFLYSIKISRLYLRMFFLASIVLFAASSVIWRFVLHGILSTQYGSYERELGTGSGNGVLILLLAYFLYIFFKNRERINDDAEYRLEVHMLLFSIALNIFSLSLTTAGRLMWYTKIALIFILPNTIDEMKLHKEAVVADLLFVFACFAIPLIYYFSIMSSDNAGVVPYYLFWSN